MSSYRFLRTILDTQSGRRTLTTGLFPEGEGDDIRRFNAGEFWLLIPWSNGTTPARHAGNDGSIPSGITFAGNRKRACMPLAASWVCNPAGWVRLPTGPLSFEAHFGRSRLDGETEIIPGF